MEAPPSYEAAMAESNRRVSAPAITSQVPITPPILSEVSTTSLVLSEATTSQLVLSEVPASPSVLSVAPTTLPVISEVPKTPPLRSEVHTTPPIAYKEPSAPPVLSELASAPPAPSQLASAPSILCASHISPALQPTFGSLTDETIRKVCYDFAAKNFENGTRVIEYLDFPSIRSCYSLHYKLETFWESREFVIKNGKCNGKPIDGSNNGPEPNIRSIFVVCKQKFQNAETHAPVPHSEHLRNCRKCDDRGKEDCLVCKGAGWNPCSRCNGDGYLKDRSACLTCNKTGRLICDPCYSCGRINCIVCDGHKKVKTYKELKVTWTNHVDESDVNPTDIPSDLLRLSTSNEIFSEESPRVQPLSTFPEARINIASLNLVFKHQKDCANKVVLLQRQSVRAVPITKINYYCKGKTGEFYVYGIENSVYFKNYSELLDYIS
nr:protein SSUH2 homolog [Parasteatoda tepidariorum]